MKKKTLEVVKEVGDFQIVKYYADDISQNNDINSGTSQYGDIYTSKEDALSEHPNSNILEGFGVHDKEYGYSPDDAKDWYETIDDALAYIENR